MKNIFIKSAFILIIGGIITKCLGFFIKIYYTRIIGSDAISLLALSMPTYSLLLSIANFNIQTAVTKQISVYNNSRKTIINSLYLMFLLDFVLILFIFIFGKFISIHLIKNKYVYLPILCSVVSLPFISVGYIVKGYFYARSNVLPHMISNVLEQLFRLLLMVMILPITLKYNYVITVSVFFLLNIFTEGFSIIILSIFLPNNFKLSKSDFKFDKYEVNELINISSASVLSRIICNIGYFFEPIIYTNLLMNKGFDINTITLEYGIYHMYAVSLLVFPTFMINSISNIILPKVSKLYYDRQFFKLKKLIRYVLTLLFSVGSLCTLFIFIFRDNLLLFLYNTNLGSNYIKHLAPFFILFYLEGPISTILIGIDKVWASGFISISGMIVKLVSLVLCIIFNTGYYSILISEIFNIAYVTILSVVVLWKSLRT